MSKWDAIVVGGGFYGCAIALALKGRVLIVEREGDVLLRASYNNQARVHNGYHYPRSLPTALSSHRNYTRFCADFKDAIDNSFTKVYAIARIESKTSAAQYQAIYKLLNAPICPAPALIRDLFSPATTEDVFVVDECAFNADLLRQILRSRLREAAVSVHKQSEVSRISNIGDALQVHTSTGVETTERVVLCAYAGTNSLLENSHLLPLPLKLEETEVCLIEPPAALKHLGITVMDGPFFSVMPFPPNGCHSLTHVTYTPMAVPPFSNYPQMLLAAKHFLPCMRDARYIRSLFETKTVPVQNEVDDGRPVLTYKNYGMAGLTVVLGGKFDSVYDVLGEL